MRAMVFDYYNISPFFVLSKCLAAYVLEVRRFHFLAGLSYILTVLIEATRAFETTVRTFVHHTEIAKIS